MACHASTIFTASDWTDQSNRRGFMTSIQPNVECVTFSIISVDKTDGLFDPSGFRYISTYGWIKPEIEWQLFFHFWRKYTYRNKKRHFVGWICNKNKKKSRGMGGGVVVFSFFFISKHFYDITFHYFAHLCKVLDPLPLCYTVDALISLFSMLI